MKLWGNWGLWTAVFIVSFLIANIVFLFVISAERFDMVEDNYYTKELVYQEQIDKIARTNVLKDTLKIRRTGVNMLQFEYPDDFIGKEFKGNIHFYRPSNKDYDFNIDINPDDSLNQEFDYSKVIRGVWILKFNWMSGDTSYYFEQELIL